MSHNKYKQKTPSEIEEEGMKKWQQIEDSEENEDNDDDDKDYYESEIIYDSQEEDDDNINEEEASLNDLLYEEQKEMNEDDIDLNEAQTDIADVDGLYNSSDEKEDQDLSDLQDNSKIESQTKEQRNKQLAEQYRQNMDPLMLNYNILINNYVYDKPVQRPKRLMFANKIQYTEYLLQMHIEDYLAGLRSELNQCIKQLTDETNPQLIEKAPFDYLDYLTYSIESIQFHEVGFCVFMKVIRENEKVFLLNAQETDTFKDESLIVFLNHKNAFLFTGTIISLEEEAHYKIYYEQETNNEVKEVIIKKNRKDIMRERKEMKLKKNQEGLQEEEQDCDEEQQKIKEEENKENQAMKSSNKKKKKKDHEKDENGEYEDHYIKKEKKKIKEKEVYRQQVEFTIKLKININKDNAESILQELIEQKTYGDSKRRLLAFEVLNYWLPFKYTYLSLKSMLQKEISFEEELIKGNIKPNQYYFNKEIPENAIEDQITYPKYKFFGFFDDIKNYFEDIIHRVDSLKNLDLTQNECLKYMLTTPISLVQGPPGINSIKILNSILTCVALIISDSSILLIGTGKTFISFEAMKLLLQTYSKKIGRKPILIICRRNETVNDYSMRLIKLFDEQYNRMEKEKQQRKEEERKKAEKENEKKEEESKNYGKNSKGAANKNNKKANNKNKKDTKNNTDKEEKSSFEYVRKDKDNPEKKPKKVYPYIRLGTGGLQIPKEIEVLFLPNGLKFIKKSKEAESARKNLLNLIQNQRETQQKENWDIEWMLFELKFNYETNRVDSEVFSFSTMQLNYFLSEQFSTINSFDVFNCKCLQFQNTFKELFVFKTNIQRNLSIKDKHKFFQFHIIKKLTFQKILLQLLKSINPLISQKQYRIADLLIKEFFSSPLTDQIIYKKRILEKKQIIFHAWFDLKLNSEKFEEILEVEIARDIKKKIDYFNKSLIMQRNNFQEIYDRESYNLVTFKSYFINMEEEKLDFSNENFYSFISSFTNLSEISYFHINSIKEYIRFSCKSDSLRQFIDDVKDYEINYQKEKKKLKKRQLEYFNQKDIILMTLTQSHIYCDVLQNLEPEIIFVDEAAENHESEMAHLLSFKPKHIIQVGDHFQLKPIMNDNTLKLIYKYGFSQFQRIYSTDIPKQKLIYQRRMTPALSKFVRLFYSEDTYKDTKEQTNQFYQKISDNKLLEKKQQDVIFVPHTFQETKHDKYRYCVNYYEAFLCIKIAERLVVAKRINPTQITILTMYKGQQLQIKEFLLKTEFDQQFNSKIKKITVATVDSYQGKENDYIIVSFVRSNEFRIMGFLAEKNRINVAFSRAKLSAYYICNLNFFSQLKNQTSNWSSIRQLANDNFHIYTENYLKKNTECFEEQWRKCGHNVKTKCMFCNSNCHVGLCKTDYNLIVKNEQNQKFLNPSQREKICKIGLRIVIKENKSDCLSTQDVTIASN